MQMAQTQHGCPKSNTDASNPTQTSQTQRGCLKPTMDTSNPMQTHQTQCRHFQPNMDTSNPTQTCWVKYPMSYIDCGCVELNTDTLNPPGCAERDQGVEGLMMAWLMRFMDHGECRIGQYFVYDICYISNFMYFISIIKYYCYSRHSQITCKINYLTSQ